MSTLALAVRELRNAELEPTTLNLPDGLAFDRYEQIGIALGTLHRASQWWLGDWIIYGEATYGEKYAQAMESTGLNKDTLRHYVWVCSRVAPSRRVEGLHFTTHAKVAALTPKEQRRWLALAKREGLSSRDLELRIQEEQNLLGAQQGVPPTRSADPDRAGRSSSQRDTPTGSPSVDRTPSGLPVSYVVPGPIVRRLVGEAVEGRNGYVRVPSELIDRLSSVMQDDE